MRNNGVFLWGVKDNKRFKQVKKAYENREAVLVALYAGDLGFIGLGVPHDILVEEQKEPYWCDEKEKAEYSYRFRIKLLYIVREVREHLQDLCRDPCSIKSAEDAKLEKSMIPQRREIDKRLEKIRVLPTSNLTLFNRSDIVSTLINYFKEKIHDGILEPFDKAHIFTLLSHIYRIDALMKKISELRELVVLFHLFTGKNVLVTGPPGAGKTSFLKKLMDKLGVKYRVETGNPEWTPFDTLGGPTLTHERYRRGFIVDAVESCRKELEKGSLYWLIIDEINRANVDLSFGKFFTLMDPPYRLREPLRIYDSEGQPIEFTVPLSFRVLATMNNYDRALLFKLGYALTRRFAVVNYTYLDKLSDYYNKYLENSRETLGELQKLSESDRSGELGLRYEDIWEELKLCNQQLVNDCITPLDFAKYTEQAGETWREEIYSLEIPDLGSIRLDNVAVNIVLDINEILEEIRDCEICPIKITPGVLADVLKYLAIGIYVYKNKYLDHVKVSKRQEKIEPGAYTLILLDSAFSAYIIPQLDILADYAREKKLRSKLVIEEKTSKSEREKPEEKKQEEKKPKGIEGVALTLERYRLVYSAELLRKISEGYHVF